MAKKLKHISEQVIVITGASSGIGLATARRAAAQGAKVVLAARSTEALKHIVATIEQEGGTALAVVADVSKREDLERVLSEALRQFGRVDTWVNNAGVAIYGRLEQVSDADSRRLFDVNFWGIVNGSLVAIEALRASEGALINIGSEVSDAVVPLQGMYVASKHAVKGFTDALRLELEQVDRSRVTVTLIQPTAVDTPYPQHAKNYMNEEPRLPTPRVAPEHVAEAILAAATSPIRAVRVGMMSKLNTVIAKILPSVGDNMSAKQVNRQQYAEPPRHPDGTLYHAGESGHTRGSGGVEV